MGGDEVLRQLKADPRHADLPVLMISALDEQGSVARCIEAGAENYLPKGVDPVLLRARMGACLRKKRARDQELPYLRDVRVLTAGAAALQVDRDALCRQAEATYGAPVAGMFAHSDEMLELQSGGVF